MYAITFDIDTNELRAAYPNASYTNAYADIRRVLTGEFGFTWRQGSVYFGTEHITPVDCTMAVQELMRRFPWFSRSVKDLRMLRIEENNDLGGLLV
ncbi:hypothetical protein GKQ51_13400 [Azotobacter chroococcum]|uniref:Uncharacterized protein n=1 Tax=Azotobacter chroococcum TaxID=353 RepID=A0AAP9YAK0_9GAMM|nr:hypothetical protein GKQ51_13400 [Azotobacter chroococcum]